MAMLLAIFRRFSAFIAVALLLAGVVGAAAQPAMPNAPGMLSQPTPAATYQLFLPLLSNGGAAPSSAELIKSAVASGALDAETGLIYRVYAVFADPRLPVAFQGDDSAGGEGEFVLELATQLWDDLKPTTRSALQPFFTPPAYAASWAGSTAGSAVAATGEPLCGGLTATWQWIDSSNGKARFWWNDSNPTDGKQARMLAEQFDNVIWPKLRGLMGRDNLSDAEKGCNGLDGRLDIYLTAMPGQNPAKGWNITYPPSCNTAPTFIQLNRTLPTTELRSALAHELMHAFQWAFKSSLICNRDEDRWWREATATWVMHYVYPQDNLEWDYAQYMLDNPGISLERFKDENDKHPYGAYLLPFFMQNRFSADTIRASWENLAQKDSLGAVNLALPGGFEQAWPEFALYNWNAVPAPYESYQSKWDGLTQRAKPVVDHAVQVAGTHSTLLLPVEVDHLATEYYRFTFPDSNARGITFYNGVSFKGEILVADSGNGLAMRPIPAEERKAVKVQALIKIGGQWRYEDWTERPYAFFCRDQIAERIEELVLIFTNSSQDKEYVVQPTGEAPVLAASNAGCWKWQGTATVRTEAHDLFTNSWMTENLQAGITWERLPPMTDPIDGAYWQLSGYSFEPKGTLQWAYDEEMYDADPPDVILCKHTGSGTFPLAGNGLLGLHTGGVLDGPGERDYSGWGEPTQRGSYTSECMASPPSSGTHELDYFDPDITPAHISADGQTISGRREVDCSDEFRECTEIWEWKFTAVRE